MSRSPSHRHAPGVTFGLSPVPRTRVRAIATVEWLDEASLYVGSLIAGIAAGVLVAFL